MIITSMVIPPPLRRVNTVQIAGRDGNMYETTDNYEDIDIKVSLTTINPRREYVEWHAWWSKVKQWLLSAHDRIKIGAYPGKYFKVKNIRLGDPERTWYISSSMEVTITCDPYIYLDDGDRERALTSGKLYADCSCNPVYKFAGETTLTLAVNGHSITVNIGQNIALDTELMTCYRVIGSANVIANADVEGDPLDKLRLMEGENTIAITSPGDVTASVIPHWRHL
ncbi:hypothetical protein [Eubacterium aggregans]|nr:hypothetical protein [Eubacterium aggregans]